MNQVKHMFVLAVATLAAVFVQAAALTEAVNTPFRVGASTGILQASNVVYGGSIAAISLTTGLIVPATDTTTNMMVVGCIRQTSDNGGISAANYSATRKVSASRGVFRWDNGDSFTAADVGQVCYIEDDHTVQKAASATYDIPVGVIVEVDSDGVWVDTTTLSKVLAGSLGTLTVSGTADVTGATTVGALTTTGTTTLGGTTVAVTNNATVAGTLAVTGVATFTAAPKLTGITAPGALIATITNLPATVSSTNTPLWMRFTCGTTNYVVPAWPL